MLECCSLHFNKKIAESFHEKVKFWTAKVTKIIKILDFSKMLTSAKYFVEFQCFDKKIAQSMFSLPKTPIKTKYKCQKTEKVELDKYVNTIIFKIIQQYVNTMKDM